MRGYQAEIWFGIFAPTGTPREIIERVNAEVSKAVSSPDDQNAVVGVWSTTERRKLEVTDADYSGGSPSVVGDKPNPWVQVSRLGNPLVNEVVNPLQDKDKFNASAPWDDAQFLKNVTNPELPKLIEGIYKIKAPAEPRMLWPSLRSAAKSAPASAASSLGRSSARLRR